ncbi:hypothetical protein AZSI13_25540 [Azospira sp. I13]|nr:hypothetical protein AZSI13_25540 [Azospira sp. I13]
MAPAQFRVVLQAIQLDAVVKQGPLGRDPGDDLQLLGIGWKLDDPAFCRLKPPVDGAGIDTAVGRDVVHLNHPLGDQMNQALHIDDGLVFCRVIPTVIHAGEHCPWQTMDQPHVHGAEEPFDRPLVLRGFGAREEDLDPHFQTGRFQGVRVKIRSVIHGNQFRDTVSGPLAPDVRESGQPFILR